MLRRKASGFTLIELLVTLALMSLLLALVAPFTSKTIERASLTSEIVDLKLRARRASALALMNNCPVELELHDYVLQGRSACLTIPQNTYQYLTANEFVISFNNSGIPDKREVVLPLHSEPVTFDLYEVLGLIDE